MTEIEKTNSTPSKQPPPWLFALGYGHMPEEFDLAGKRFHFCKLFKHDFYAATGLYQTNTPHLPIVSAGINRTTEESSDPTITPTGELAVLKIQRTYPLFGLPMRWLGAWIASHEVRIFRKLQGIAGIPDFMGTLGTNGYIHGFVPGCDLSPDCRPDAEFFSALEKLLSDVHARHVAYVDANKRENILYGDDHRPWLIDFQISFNCRRNQHDNFLAQWILKRLQAEDWYHYYKHKTRLAPDICTAEDFSRANHQSWYIRLHRAFARPVIHGRRRFLSRYKSRASENQ